MILHWLQTDSPQTGICSWEVIETSAENTIDEATSEPIDACILTHRHNRLYNFIVTLLLKNKEALGMESFIELLVVLITSFGFNLIPFAGPSNLFIASNLALIYGIEDPAFLLALGFLVALGATLAKSTHYLVTFFVSKHLKEKQRQRLERKSHEIKRWAFLLLFAAAASPIPDEPVVIPLGLLKYSPVKFFSAFFLGKLSITVVGAFLGSWTKRTFSEWLSPELMVALSIILTIAVTILILKVDIGKLAQKIPRKSTPSN